MKIYTRRSKSEKKTTSCPQQYAMSQCKRAHHLLYNIFKFYFPTFLKSVSSRMLSNCVPNFSAFDFLNRREFSTVTTTCM